MKTLEKDYILKDNMKMCFGFTCKQVCELCPVVLHCECVCLCVSLSHIEDLRYLCVVEEVLFLVVFLELCCIVVPALLRCVCAGMGMLLGLQSER